jgi:signal transduction histidine kinase
LIIFTVLNALTLIIAYGLEVVYGPPPMSVQPHIFDLIMPLAMLGLGFVLVRFSARSIQAAFARVHRDEQTLTETNHALTLYSHELEARNIELDAFAHTVAHDLRNVLASLVLTNSFLMDDHYQLSSTERATYRKQINHGLKTMTTTIDALLLLSRVRERADIDVVPLNMPTIVHEALRQLAHLLAGFPEDALRLSMPVTWPTAEGYEPWVEEIWVNYLSNAIKYGGRPLHIDVGGDIYPPLTSGGAVQVRFWVKDNGPGLTPEERDKLFTPFERLNNSRVEGHGLGLSIVARMATKLGGTVGVDSEPGDGSTFWFTLPLASEHKTAFSAAPASQIEMEEVIS